MESKTPPGTVVGSSISTREPLAVTVARALREHAALSPAEVILRRGDGTRITHAELADLISDCAEEDVLEGRRRVWVLRRTDEGRVSVQAEHVAQDEWDPFGGCSEELLAVPGVDAAPVFRLLTLSGYSFNDDSGDWLRSSVAPPRGGPPCRTLADYSAAADELRAMAGAVLEMEPDEETDFGELAWCPVSRAVDELARRVAVAHQAALALERSADRMWVELRPLLTVRWSKSARGPVLRARVEEWWTEQALGTLARERLGTLAAKLEAARSYVGETRLEAAQRGLQLVLPLFSSGGGPLFGRVGGLPAPSSAPSSQVPYDSLFSPDLPGISSVLELEDSAHRSPIRDDGPPTEIGAGCELAPLVSELEDLETGSTSSQDTAQAPVGLAGLSSAALELCAPTPSDQRPRWDGP